MPKDPATKDFSGGRRLRFVLTVYQKGTRSFKPEEKALVTVKDRAEQKRLWSAILRAIEHEGWRAGAGA